MKIVHIDPDDLDSPTSGGGPVRTFEIYRRLAARHEITVLTPSFDNCTREKIRDGVRYIRLGRKYRNHNSSYYISFYFSAPFAAKQYPSDLLVEDLMPPTTATITPVLNRRKIVASVQWFFAKEWASQYKIPFHWYQPFGLKFYQNFIVLTEDMREIILRYQPKANIRVIPNGLNADFFESEPTEGDFILYLGRVENEQKGVDLLIEAFHKISDQTDVNLLIAGDGVDLERAKERVQQLQLANRIIFVGKVGMVEKKKLLSSCRFVVVPSRYETFCMVALEAFACGKTVVSYDIPFLDVVKKEFAVRVPSFKVDEYAGALLSLLNDRKTTLAMGRTAREYARNLLWDKLALEQEEFYKKVIFN